MLNTTNCERSINAQFEKSHTFKIGIFAFLEIEIGVFQLKFYMAQYL